MDDFEFRPITDGLGFHHTPKKEAPKEPVKKSVPLKSKQDLVSTLRGQDLGGSFQAKGGHIPPFPLTKTFHPESNKSATVSAAATAAKKASEIFSPSINVEKQKSNISFGAITVDSIVVLGISLLFTVAVLVVAEAKMDVVLYNLETDFMTKISVGALLITVIYLYFLIFRTFLGATLGEWAFDLQMGTKAEQKSGWYPLEVLSRTTLVLITGAILLPLVSLITGTDWTGRICGLEIYRE